MKRIALLALVLFLSITPAVFADSLIGHYEGDGATGGISTGTLGNNYWKGTAVNATNVTRIEMTDANAFVTAPAANCDASLVTYPGYVIVGTTHWEYTASKLLDYTALLQSTQTYTWTRDPPANASYLTVLSPTGTNCTLPSIRGRDTTIGDYGDYNLYINNIFAAPCYDNACSVDIYGKSPSPPAPGSIDYACNFDLSYPYEQSPFDVDCWDASTLYPAATNHTWVATQPDSTTIALSAANFTTTLSQNGWYGLDYKVCNSLGCGYKNDTTWLNLSANPPPATGLTVNIFVRSAESSALLFNSYINVKNITDSTWWNASSLGGFKALASTDAAGTYKLTQGQSVYIEANATGYKTSGGTLVIPYDQYVHDIFLVSNSVVNATGKGTVVVTVVSDKTGTPLSDVSLEFDSGQLGYTNSAGTATIKNVTAGDRTITATKSGYQTGEKSFSLTAGDTSLQVMKLVLNGETPITTYVSPTQVSFLVDTDGDGIPDTESAVVGNYTAGQLNQAGASAIMGIIGLILQLWPLIIILVLLKLIKVI